MSTATQSRSGARVHVQKFGTFLSNMVMPNIGAFIAWGLITALFIDVGWLPIARLGGFGVDAGTCANEIMNAAGDMVALPTGMESCSANGGLVGPMITYLLPLLIGFTGGHNIYGHRGGVVGAIATMGIIAGTSIPMFMGAMIMGPLGGWTMKKLDAIWSHKIPPGFEMLINNFSAGIWGMLLSVFGFFVMSPIVTGLSNILEAGVDTLVNNGLLPLTSILIEPGKILFLNNAINHGVLTPLGTQEALETGKSVLFLLEANPGPGLGLLLAYIVFGRGTAKASAPGAAIIHFLGGIHEIYFPYVLMRPVLVIAMILSGMTGVFINVLFDTGLRAPAAPGSILAIYAQTAPGSYLGVTLSWIGAATVSFLVAGFLLKTSKVSDEDDLTAATARMEEMKGKKSSVAGQLGGGEGAVSAAGHSGPIKNIVFACDAGMGSSAMGASVLRKKVQAAGYKDVTVINKAISTLTDTFDLVVTHKDLTERAQQRTASAIHVSVDNFMGSPRYDEIVELLHKTNGGQGGDAPAPAASSSAGATLTKTPSTTGTTVLSPYSIVVNGTATDKAGAITEAGNLLVMAGVVPTAYVDAMHERETSVSTFMGNGLAIPHGTNEAKSMIDHSGISFVRYPNGIDWNGKEVNYVIGIAGAGNDHMGLLGKIADVFLDKDQVAKLEAATSTDDILDILGGVNS
ncbi:MAG: PTS mannitol transporter subunit IICBA [Actinomycetales bacterium]